MTLSELLERKYGALVYRFKGGFRGHGSGFPKEVGRYKTNNYGELSYFKGGAPIVEGYVRVYEYIGIGCACTPYYYVAAYVPRDRANTVAEYVEKYCKLSGWDYKVREVEGCKLIVCKENLC